MTHGRAALACTNIFLHRSCGSACRSLFKAGHPSWRLRFHCRAHQCHSLLCLQDSKSVTQPDELIDFIHLKSRRGLTQLELEDEVATDLQKATGLVDTSAANSANLNRVLQLTGQQSLMRRCMPGPCLHRKGCKIEVFGVYVAASRRHVPRQTGRRDAGSGACEYSVHGMGRP